MKASDATPFGACDGVNRKTHGHISCRACPTQLNLLVPDPMVRALYGAIGPLPATDGDGGGPMTLTIFLTRLEPDAAQSLQRPDRGAGSVAASRACVSSAGRGSTLRSPLRMWPVPTVPIPSSRPAVLEPTARTHGACTTRPARGLQPLSRARNTASL
jgi:hypothetical protein